MNNEYKSSSRIVRSIIAVLATVSTVLVASGIAGLADHYNGQRTQVAAVDMAHRG